MKPLNIKPTPYLYAISLSVFLTACGGGSDSGNTNAAVPINANTTTQTEVEATPPSTASVTPAVEAPVVTPPAETPQTSLQQAAFASPSISGLGYTTATQTGMTDQDGQFSFASGESITFAIGDITFENIPAQNINTLFELAQTHIISDRIYSNMARLLYTLDLDGNPDNGIQISDETHRMAQGVTADFSSPNFDSQVANLVSSSQNATTVLITEQQARNNITAQLDTDGSCARTSSKVGQAADLSMLQHDVQGRLRVLNDCTIEVSQFSFDGEGAGDVRFYNLENSDIYGENLQGTVFNNTTFLLKVTPEQLEEMNRISVWCIPLGIDFGNGTFR